MISLPPVLRMRRTSLIPLAASLAVLVASVAFTGCNKSKTDEKHSDASAKDWVDFSDATAEERNYLEYGRGVVQAVSAQDYTAFYNQLSSHARARMSLNQFAPAEDEAVFARQEKQAVKDVTLPRFLELMQLCETQFGRPATPLNLHVHSTDATALAYEVTVEELQKDEDFEPYLALKLVLIAGNGGLQVGYFEFLPPSMMD